LEGAIMAVVADDRWFALHLRDGHLELGDGPVEGRLTFDGQGVVLVGPIGRWFGRQPVRLRWDQPGWRIARSNNGVAVRAEKGLGVRSWWGGVTVYAGDGRGRFARAITEFGDYLVRSPAARQALDEAERCERLLAALAPLRKEPPGGWPFGALLDDL
jgi:hypothetical protein